MSVVQGGSNSPHHAITDLYDVDRRAFLIQYPIWFIITLSMAGVVAFAMTGFLGYTPDSAFHQPWALFLWFCALLITLQASILRSQSLRGRLIATLIISAIAIVVIFLTNFGGSLPDIIRKWLESGHFLRALIGQAGSYAFLNFFIIGIFWVDTVRRWIRRSRGLPPYPRVYIGIEASERVEDEEDLPSLQELISGDLMAGAVLALGLAFLFQAPFLGNFIHPDSGAITTCTLSWPFGACVQPGGGLANPPTLRFIDLIQALIYLPLGLLILALSATLSGLGAVQGVNERQLDQKDEVVASRKPNATSTGAVAADVTETVLDTLRSALDRRLRLLLNNFLLAIRYLAWPALILVGTYGLAQVAISVQSYLHSGKGFTDVISYAGPALGWGIAAVLGTVFSAALMLFRWRVADNTLRFLGLIGLVTLLTFWIFSLALWGFNQLLLQTNATLKHPFDPPSWLTVLSLLALVGFGVLLVVRRMGGPRSGTRSPATVGARPNSGS